ncbi:MAG: ATP-binding cassette domain-containing protein [Nitrospiraceae bacterium]|nr:ATP-binding cassette domain-containing protein [Nitrospiraceae bacterium]
MELLKVEGLKKYFEVKKKIAGSHLILKAVDGIDFSIQPDRVFALVGESGCGKSTVARLVLKLTPPSDGKIFFNEKDISGLNGNSLKAFRRSVQIVFQDPFASLNPRRTVFDTLSEPLKIHHLVQKNELKNASADLLRNVGLNPDVLSRYPHEFSGGQRQRICIARALAVNPKLIVADEPLSALDVSIQAQMINLLQELRAKTKIAFLFISHDLKIVNYFSDDVAVMYLGKIVEHAKTEDLFKKPLHPYTEILLSSAPGINPVFDKKTLVDGEVPSPINIPPGCPFHPRCPKKFEPCDNIVPELRNINSRLVSCHLWK